MAHPTGGVKPFSLQGRLGRERERLHGMTDEERQFRRKYLKSQILEHGEPREVPEIYKELRNPIRRAYVIPLNAFGNLLKPTLGPKLAMGVRIVTGKLLMGIVLIYAGAYYFKYNRHDWTWPGGIRLVTNLPRSFPGDPDYPKVSERKTGADYADQGFKNSPI